jgi:hypothetical protein
MRRLLMVGCLLLTCLGCGGGGGGAAGPHNQAAAKAAHELAASFRPELSTRYQDVRCASIRGIPNMDFVCALELIGLQRGPDEFAVTTARISDGTLIGSGGLAQVAATCMEAVRCWANEAIAACGPECAGRVPRVGTAGPALPRRATPLTPANCIKGWNIHGQFTAAETADTRPALLASQEVTKPVYTPYLAAASIGFVAARAQVTAVPAGCAVVFDLGGGRAYRIFTTAGADPWVWTWQGDPELTDAPPRWNACQRADGTLASSGCDSIGPKPRDVIDELSRDHLSAVARVGGTPYWLGAPFAGAWPSAQAQGDVLIVEYRVTAGGQPLTLRVYRSSAGAVPAATITGTVIVRAHPQSGAVLVTAVPASAAPAVLRRSILTQLRPFQQTNPAAPQQPGDVTSSPTSIDTSQPRRPFWFGATLFGMRATVISSSPAGVGLVRYGAADAPHRFYVVTYKPVLKNCGSLGCVTPPPLPKALMVYGQAQDTWIHDDWLTVILVRKRITGTDPFASLATRAPTLARS